MVINNVNPNKLHDELINAGITPLLLTHDKVYGEITAKNTEISFAEGTDMTLVQAVIESHNPEPLPPLPTQDDYLIDLDFRVSMLELGI